MVAILVDQEQKTEIQEQKPLFFLPHLKCIDVSGTMKKEQNFC